VIHACRPADLPFWAGGALYEIELGGAVVEEHILLRGQLDDASAQSGVEPPPGSAIDTRPALMGQVAAALPIAGLGFLNVAEARAGLTRLAQPACSA
jgi:hypothetical protein